MIATEPEAAPVSLRIGVQTDEGVFLVYDAMIPPDNPRTSPGYLAYWSDFASESIYFYNGLVQSPDDVGRAMLALELDLYIDLEKITEFSPTLAWMLDQATSEVPWRGTLRGSRTKTSRPESRSREPSPALNVWQPLTYAGAMAVMGFPVVGGVATVGNPPDETDVPCNPPAVSTKPSERRNVSDRSSGITRGVALPAPTAATPRQIITQAAALVPCIPGSGPPCSGCGCNTDPCCGSSDLCCGIPDPCCRNPCLCMDCSDGIACSVDTCSGGACFHDACPCLNCDDGEACNGLETCLNGTCISGTPMKCDDGDACNGVETCSGGMCVAGTPMACDDGDACNGTETCSAGMCVAGTPMVCDDGMACNGVETCSGGACVDGTPMACDDGDACNGTETCSAGMCVAGTPMVCDDGMACNGLETCLNGTCISGTPMKCDDGEACNGVETCSGGACVDGTPMDCDDNDPCTADSCANSACLHDPVPITATLTASPTDIAAKSTGSPWDFSIITVAWNPPECEGTLKIVTPLVGINGYTPPNDGTLQRINATTWVYTSFDEPQAELCPEDVTVTIAGMQGTTQVGTVNVRVRPVHTFWTHAHRHGPAMPLHSPSTADFTNDYDFLRWKYAGVLATTGGFFTTKKISTSFSVTCPNGKTGFACTTPPLTPGWDVVFGTSTFLGTENAAASIIGHELVHASGIWPFAATECTAYTWELNHSQQTGVYQCDPTFLGTITQNQNCECFGCP